MLSQRTLAIAGPAALLLACASSPTSSTGDNDKQAEQGPDTPDNTTDNAEAKQAQPAASATPFAYTAYPKEARVDRGGMGVAKSGTLIAASTDAQVAVESTWADGPSVVVFYRGHW